MYGFNMTKPTDGAMFGLVWFMFKGNLNPHNIGARRYKKQRVSESYIEKNNVMVVGAYDE